jgi:putative Mn2+ efflux pump MntP
MSSLEIGLIAVGLAMDAFAVSLAASASGRASGKRAAFRLSFHFGFFQFLMPIAGWLAGSRIAPLMTAIDHWIAFGLLGFVGVRMIRSGLRPEQPDPDDPSKGWTLVMLSIATSIDALAVGFSLAMLGISIWTPSIVIGLVAAALSLIGIAVGKRLGRHLGKRVEIVGGLILILIGFRIVVEHLTG